MCRKIVLFLLIVFCMFLLSIRLGERNEWKITDLDGYVVVYDGFGRIFEMTDISIKRLPAKEQEDLMLGISVSDRFRLEQILDGLSQ